MTNSTVASERPPGRPDADYAFKLARSRFLAGERIDMQQLAAELGVDRSTLFRWVGNRDTLIADILSSMTGRALDQAAEGVDSVGGLRVAQIARNYAQSLMDAPFFQAYLQREPQRALRLLTTKASPLQRRVVKSFERILEQEVDRGNLEHEMALEDLAYLVVRIFESFVYADLIAGNDPDPAKIETALVALLRAGLPPRA